MGLKVYVFTRPIPCATRHVQTCERDFVAPIDFPMSSAVHRSSRVTRTPLFLCTLVVMACVLSVGTVVAAGPKPLAEIVSLRASSARAMPPVEVRVRQAGRSSIALRSQIVSKSGEVHSESRRATYVTLDRPRSAGSRPIRARPAAHPAKVSFKNLHPLSVPNGLYQEHIVVDVTFEGEKRAARVHKYRYLRVSGGGAWEISAAEYGR